MTCQDNVSFLRWYSDSSNGLSLQRITCVIPLPGEII